MPVGGQQQQVSTGQQATNTGIIQSEFICTMTFHRHRSFFTLSLLLLSLLPLIHAENCLYNDLELLQGSPLVKSNVQLVLHRSGEPEPCGMTALNIDEFPRQGAEPLKCQTSSRSLLNKYELDSFLTTYFHNQIGPNDCGSTDNATAPAGLRGWCDMGPERTILSSSCCTHMATS